MHEESHETFHGREIGYTYKAHDTERAHGHLGFHTAEAEHGIRHGETFGTHYRADEYEVEHGDHSYDAHAKEEHYIEPTFEYEHESPYYAAEHLIEESHEDADQHYVPSTQRTREVEYEVDEEGHVHMYEETPEYHTSFLQ